jgi:hypothetical protein
MNTDTASIIFEKAAWLALEDKCEAQKLLICEMVEYLNEINPVIGSSRIDDFISRAKTLNLIL